MPKVVAFGNKKVFLNREQKINKGFLFIFTFIILYTWHQQCASAIRAIIFTTNNNEIPNEILNDNTVNMNTTLEIQFGQRVTILYETSNTCIVRFDIPCYLQQRTTHDYFFFK